jgi:hypothetical protein
MLQNILTKLPVKMGAMMGGSKPASSTCIGLNDANIYVKLLE